MYAKFHHIGIALCATFLLTGCVSNGGGNTATTTASKPPTSDKRTQHMRQWVGKKVEELVAEFGQPASTIDATVLGRAAAEAYIYPSPGASCTDAFVVIEDTGEVSDYFCR